MDKSTIIINTETEAQAVNRALSPVVVRKQADATSIKEEFAKAADVGKRIHCIELIDCGIQRGESNYKSRIYIFTKPGQCDHKDTGGCAGFLADLPADAWVYAEAELKLKIEKIVRDKANNEMLNYLQRALLTRAEKLDYLNGHIRAMVERYPNFYKS